MPPAIDPSTVRAVVFDIGGVFLIPHHERIRPALAEAGIHVPADDGAFHRAHHVAVHAIAEAVRSDGLEATEASVDTWRVYDAAFFTTAGVSDDQIAAASAVREQQRRQGVSGVWVYPLLANIAAFALQNAFEANYEFEPDPTTLLDTLLPRYVEARVYAALLNAAASEHAVADKILDRRADARPGENTRIHAR